MTTPRHFLDLPLIPPDVLKAMLAKAHNFKSRKFNPPQIFAGLTLAMVFDKKSTRTRLSFEVAMKQLGGHVVVMNADEMQLTGAESIEDTARVLSRYVDGAMFRISSHETLQAIARNAGVPVINGLTDWSHPCQIMADLMTVEERKGGIQGLRVAWLGDFNNVARSWAQAAGIWGFEFIVASPQAQAEEFRHTRFTTDAFEAAFHADVVVTDTWVSMGQEGKDIARFLPYQVNAPLMARANPDAIFMHCMPIHRGEEVTDGVLATPASVVYDEAENRLHAQKAVLAWCLADTGVKI